MRKALVALTVVCFLLLAGLGWYYLVDEPLQDASFLDVPKEAPLSKEENGYYELLEATSMFEITKTQSKQLGKHKMPVDEIQRLIQNNSDVLALLREGIVKPYHPLPYLENRDYRVTKLNPMVELEIARCQGLQQANRYGEALKCYQPLLEFSYKVHAGTLIEYAVFSMIQNNLYSVLKEFIKEIPQDVESETIYKELTKILKTNQGVFKADCIQVIKGEFPYQLSIIDSAYEAQKEAIASKPWYYKVYSLFLFKRNQTKNSLLTYYKSVLHYMEAVTYAPTTPLLEEFKAIMDSDNFRKPNPKGRILAKLVAPDFNMNGSYRGTENSTTLLLSLIAMKRFEKAKGHLPKNLGELVPAYLSSLPLDAYTGEPLQYVPEQGVIYSVGTKGKYAHGEVIDLESVNRLAIKLK